MNIRNLLDSALNFLFPQTCIGCGDSGELLCEDCLLKIPRPENNLDENTIVPFSYKDKTMKEAIKLLKFKGAFSIARPVGNFMRELVLEELAEKIEMDVVADKERIILVPVPLHKERYDRRGYNQAEILAKEIISTDGGENFIIETDVLIKIKNTESQVVAKDKKGRSKNLKGAFEVKNPEKIKGKIVAIVDDVITTGATMEECEKVLKKAGVRKIYYLAIAH